MSKFKTATYAKWAFALMIVTASAMAPLTALAAMGRGDGHSGDDTSGESVQTGSRLINPNFLLNINYICSVQPLLDVLEQKYPGCEPKVNSAVPGWPRAICSKRVADGVSPWAEYRFSPFGNGDGRIYSGIVLKFTNSVSTADVIYQPGRQLNLPALMWEIEEVPAKYDRNGRTIEIQKLVKNLRLTPPVNPPTLELLNLPRGTGDGSCDDPNGYKNGNCVAYVNTRDMVRCLQQGLADLPFQKQ